MIRGLLRGRILFVCRSNVCHRLSWRVSFRENFPVVLICCCCFHRQHNNSFTSEERDQVDIAEFLFFELSLPPHTYSALKTHHHLHTQCIVRVCINCSGGEQCNWNATTEDIRMTIMTKWLEATTTLQSWKESASSFWAGSKERGLRYSMECLLNI